MSFGCKFTHLQCYQMLLKSVNIWPSNHRNKKGEVTFETQCSAILQLLLLLMMTYIQGENRFIESMCQTIMSVDELLWIINHPDVDNNLKKPFMRYFLWVYMKTAGSAVESGAGDLPHDQLVSLSLCVCSSVCLSVCLPVSVHLFVHLSVCLLAVTD